jgi:hypothetical protein
MLLSGASQSEAFPHVKKTRVVVLFLVLFYKLTFTMNRARHGARDRSLVKWAMSHHYLTDVRARANALAVVDF